ncbi:MAG: NIL domain-containing protein [Armatimonadetes bacterium]|nr:NIL domain-containing protein [Armatimonadota bacterium]
MKDRLRLTFEKDKVADPVVCQMAKQFDVTFSIRRANVETDAGWMDLELQGDDAEIERAIEWLENAGVQVSPAGGDVLAG